MDWRKAANRKATFGTTGAVLGIDDQ